MAYPRKGSITLGQAKSMLSTDPVFSILSGEEKAIFINLASQRVCSLRNQSLKEDYAADTSEIDVVSNGVIGASSYGTTADRPVFDAMTNIGYCYYDTDINAPVWWDGTTWSDI